MKLFFAFLVALSVKHMCCAMPDPKIKIDINVNVNYNDADVQVGSDNYNISVVAAFVAGVASSVAGQPIGPGPIVQDENHRPIVIHDPRMNEELSHVRVRRDGGYAAPVHKPQSYAPPVHHAPVHKPKKGYYTPGKIGPVYTFAKTDYNENFKWGVRHRAGSQYAGSYH